MVSSIIYKRINIFILYYIHQRRIIGAMEKKELHVSSLVIITSSLFTSFWKLVKSVGGGGGIVKECKRGFNFYRVWNILWFRTEIRPHMATNLRGGELKYILLSKLFISPLTNEIFKIILSPLSSISNLISSIKIIKPTMANLQVLHAAWIFIHSFFTQILLIFSVKF